MIEILDALRALLEPDPTPDPRVVALDEANAKPLKSLPLTLYLWVTQVSETGIESGPTARQDFVIDLVLTGPDAGEEPALERDPVVSSFLDTRRAGYLAAIRSNQRTSLWGSLRAASATAPATLQQRSTALRLSGYRIVG